MTLDQVCNLIVRPVLTLMATCKPALAQGCSVALVLGTGLVESNYEWLQQEDYGPALGPWEVEELTYNDMINRVVPSIIGMEDVIQSLSLAGANGAAGFGTLAGNWYLGAAICRLKYWSYWDALPVPGSAVQLATLHKSWYNTSGGAADINVNIPRFQTAIDAVNSGAAPNKPVTI
jgi:hypothetical protein